MFTIGGFFLGLLFLAVGFFMVWKAARLRQWVGDLTIIFDVSWLDWPLLGIIVMAFGGLLITGLMQTILLLIFGGFGAGF